MVPIKPVMCKCNQCRGTVSRSGERHGEKFRVFQRKLFNRKLRRKLKQNSKNGNYEMINFSKFIDYFTD